MELMDIAFSGLDKQHATLYPELLKAIQPIFHQSDFVLGNAVNVFEQQFSNYHGVAHAIGVNSGTDALILSLRAAGIGPGDEVITTANTFITTVSSIALVGATPVMIDIADDDNIDINQIEKHITNKTKAIMPVHWTGRPCNMTVIAQLAKQYQLKIIEDCAQAVSAKYQQQVVGTFGEFGCFSLHPYKTLNACGDGGIILTNDDQHAETLRALRQNGLTRQGECHYWSNNSRLDTIQAAILSIKLQYFEQWTQRRIEIAQYYAAQLKTMNEITTPTPPSNEYHSVFHTFIVKAQARDALKTYLQTQGIETRIHYQVPIYRQPIATKTLSCCPEDFPKMEQLTTCALSLPIYPELTTEQLDYIIEKIKTFYTQQKSQKKDAMAAEN
jgi:dTDP-4-amino-4,6-dideoxygalactose transaminase